MENRYKTLPEARQATSENYQTIMFSHLDNMFWIAGCGLERHISPNWNEVVEKVETPCRSKINVNLPYKSTSIKQFLQK